MTVIMGINLSDRVCLVADSRVSEKDESTGVFKPKHDNMMKIEPLRDTRGAMVASAGNAALARRVLKALNSEYKGKTIVDIRNGIEGTLRRIGEEYGAIDRFAHANFLIAGVPYKLKTSHDDATVEELVQFVNNRMNQAMAATKNGSFQNAAVLTAMNLAEELILLKRKAHRELEKLEEKALQLSMDLENSKNNKVLNN